MTKNWARQADGSYRNAEIGATLTKGQGGWDISFDVQGELDKPIRRADGTTIYHWAPSGSLASAKRDAEDEGARRAV